MTDNERYNKVNKLISLDSETWEPLGNDQYRHCDDEVTITVSETGTISNDKNYTDLFDVFGDGEWYVDEVAEYLEEVMR